MGSLNPLVITAAALAARGEAIATGLVGVGGHVRRPAVHQARARVRPRGRRRRGVRRRGRRAPAMRVRPRCSSAAGCSSASARASTSSTGSSASPPRATTRRTAPGVRHAPVVLRHRPRRRSPGACSRSTSAPPWCSSATASLDALPAALARLGGQLTLTLHAEAADEDASLALLVAGQELAGRVLFNGFPTGVAVTAAMQHGGPWPASSSRPHVGRRDRDRALPAPRRAAGRSCRAPAAGADRRQPARHLAPRGRPAHPRLDLLRQ